MAKTAKKRRDFDAKEFLATIGQGRKIIPFQKKQTIFVQGDEAGAVFYIQAGKVKLSVVSDSGKEATIAILNPGDFFGEGCLAGQPLRMGSATAIIDCALLKIDKTAIIGALHRGHAGSVCRVFVGAKHPLRRGPGGSAFQFQRETTGSDSSLARPFRQRRKARDRRSQDQPGDAGGNGGDHPLPGQFFHE